MTLVVGTSARWSPYSLNARPFELSLVGFYMWAPRKVYFLAGFSLKVAMFCSVKKTSSGQYCHFGVIYSSNLWITGTYSCGFFLLDCLFHHSSSSSFFCDFLTQLTSILNTNSPLSTKSRTVLTSRQTPKCSVNTPTKTNSLPVCPWKLMVGRQAFPFGQAYALEN